MIKRFITQNLRLLFLFVSVMPMLLMAQGDVYFNVYESNTSGKINVDVGYNGDKNYMVYHLEYLDGNTTDNKTEQYNGSILMDKRPATLTVEVHWQDSEGQDIVVTSDVATYYGLASTALTAPFQYNGTVNAPNIIPALPTDATVTYASSTAVAAPKNSIDKNTGVVTINSITSPQKDTYAAYLKMPATQGAGFGPNILNIPGNFGYELGTFTLEVTKRNISDCTVSLSPETYTYFGSAMKPTVNVKVGTYSFNEGANGDYTVSYPNEIKDAGTYTITITPTSSGRLTGLAVTKTFTMERRSFETDQAKVTLGSSSMEYNGTELHPTVSVAFPSPKGGFEPSIDASNYTVSYANATNVGTATVTVTGTGNYTGTASAQFTITAKSLSGAQFSTIPDQTYTGNEIKPEPTVTLGSVTLVKGTDFDFSYSSNTNVPVTANDVPTVTITGKGNFTGTASTTFKIVKATPTVTAPTAKTGLAYTGSAQALVNAGSVTAGTLQYKLGAGGTYGTTIPSATEVGSYAVYYKVVGDANYNDVAEAGPINVTIGKAAGSISYATSSISKTFGDAAFTNILTKTGDGAVSYSSSNTNVATVNATSGEVTIVGNGSTTITATVTDGTNYTYAAKTATYTLSVGTAAMTVSATGYTGVYDGQAHGITVTAPAGATVKYGETPGTYNLNASPTYTNAGTYTVYYQVTKANYTTVTGSQTVTISKAVGAISFASASISKTFGDAPFTNALTKSGDGTVTYSSSSTSVATVNATSGEVTIVGNGSAVITATVADGTNYTYAAKTATYTLSVGTATMTVSATAYTGAYDGQAHGIIVSAPAGATVKYGETPGTYNLNASPTYTNAGTYTVYYQVTKANYVTVTGSQTVTISKAAGAISFASASISKTFGDAPFTNALTKTGDGAVSYSSSNTNVATINATSGEVTIVGNGSAVITATVADGTNYTYAAKTATYTLSVGTAAMTVSATGYTGAYDGQAHGITVTAPAGATVKYGETAGTYNLNASPTYTNAGTYTVYYQVTKTGFDTVTGSATVTITKVDARVVYVNYEFTAKIGEPFDPPYLTLEPSDLAVTYYSADKDIATVDAQTGEVTLVAPGKVNIYATFEGDENYNSASDYYILTVLQRDIDPIDEDNTITMSDNDFLTTNDEGQQEEVRLDNTVIYDILYTLNISGDPSESDGYDETEQCVVLNHPVTDREINRIINGGNEPGSEEYADEYTGLTFKVPAGMGYVIIDSRTDGDYQMMVKIGNLAPVAFNHTGREKDSVLYECSVPTWVYVYNGGKVSNARMAVDHRAKKQKGHVKIYSVTRSSAKSSGIERINIDALESERWYDLQGNRIQRPTRKGLYILQGQKVVVK